MPPPRGKGRGAKDKRPKRNSQSLLFRRKRFCRFTVAKVEEIDYKDVDVLADELPVPVDARYESQRPGCWFANDRSDSTHAIEDSTLRIPTG